MSHRMMVGLAPWCGTPAGYRDKKCRCRACTDAATTSGKQWRRRRYEERVLVGGVLVHLDAPHGFNSGYANWGCRCRRCLHAKKLNDYPYKIKRNASRPPKQKVHGTVWGYRRGCRCEPCRRASREQMRKDRAKRFAERELVDGVLIHPRAKHGASRTSYSYYGCRCRPCVRFNYEKWLGDAGYARSGEGRS